MKKLTLLSIATISLSICAAEAFAYIGVAYTPDRKSIAVRKGANPEDAKRQAMRTCEILPKVKGTNKRCTMNPSDITNGNEFVSVVESSGDKRNWVGMSEDLSRAKSVAFGNCQRSGKGKCRHIFSMNPKGGRAG